MEHLLLYYMLSHWLMDPIASLGALLAASTFPIIFSNMVRLLKNWSVCGIPNSALSLLICGIPNFALFPFNLTEQERNFVKQY